MFAMRKKLLVGIDIGTHSIKVVRLKQRGKGYQLLNFGIMPLRPEVVVDGNIAEAEAIVITVRKRPTRRRNAGNKPFSPVGESRLTETRPDVGQR